MSVGTRKLLSTYPRYHKTSRQYQKRQRRYTEMAIHVPTLQNYMKSEGFALYLPTLHAFLERCEGEQKRRLRAKDKCYEKDLPPMPFCRRRSPVPGRRRLQPRIQLFRSGTLQDRIHRSCRIIPVNTQPQNDPDGRPS